jgi:hypothetical protein
MSRQQLCQIWATCNPVGEHNDNYNGLYLTQGDIDDIVSSDSLRGLPVKVEHKGIDIGKVLSVWKNNGKLDMLVEVDRRSMEGDITSRFVREGITQDFSLGYTVNLTQSACGKVVPAKKVVTEVSIVKKGAREHCHIHGFSFINTN